MQNTYLKYFLALSLSFLASGCGKSQSDVMRNPAVPRVPLVAPALAPASSLAKAVPATIAIAGEAIILRGTDRSETLHSIDKVIAVYSFDEHGKKIDYAEKRDWVVEGSFLKRSADSKVPDFNNYTYSTATACGMATLSKACVKSVMSCFSSKQKCPYFGGGKAVDIMFDFAVEPRNPPLNINYNIYVDYVTTAVDRLITSHPISPKRNPNVLCMGDSIVAGSHTVASHYRGDDSESWCGLLRKYLGPESTTTNESVPGGELAFVKANLAGFLASNPDVIVLGFGMNDHMAGEAGLPAFSATLDEVVASIRLKGIKVILVGFFQQNPLWIREDPAQTVAYNSAVEKTAAKHGVPFIDVETAFKKASPRFEPYYQLTGDFMHHPNKYGQRIYFSLLAPYFLRSDTLSSNIDGYVHGVW
jgi:lysophospholipase L1-like esterase